ncbi:MAG TPA: alpha-galactosidase [Candidatus Nanopelagicaceae bacterium]
MRAHISNNGVDLLIEVVAGAFVVRHWGKSISLDSTIFPTDQSIPNSDFDKTQNPGFLREHSRGFLGYPTISGHRNGRDWSTQFTVKDIKSTKNSAVIILEDKNVLLNLNVEFKILESGLIEINAVIENLGESYVLNEFTYWLPLPDRAEETLDFVGRWSNERNPQRRPIGIGRWVRDSREGKTGHNATIGEIALTKETTFSSGEVWSIALGWSGNHQYLVERDAQGSISIGAGELLAPGEVILAKGESYRAPRVFAGYSEDGIDGVAHKFHEMLRARPNHPKKLRPLTLNLWEAIYFQHSESRVKELIDRAAQIGVERIVLDDGWFGSRRDDRSGLGDWFISKEVWPNGLSPISEYALSKGIEFGLWFEGEMFNSDSDLFRMHPDWALGEQSREIPTWRHQQVLNLANADVFAYVLEAVSSVISSSKVSYIKWDHNRVLIDAGSDGRPAYREQVLAIYRLFDELKKMHKGLEIESCASGGGRIDLGIVDHVDRFWVSDNNDALERQRIQRWTSQFIPFELLGTHIGPSPSHQTGRSLSLTFRAITALFGHAGIEWDISSCSPEELKFLKLWADYYKDKRSLIHSGEIVRVDYPDSHHHLYGVRTEGESIFGYAQLETISTSQPPRIRIPGLADRNYEIRIPTISKDIEMMLIKPPTWVSEGCKISGSILSEIGLAAPILKPGEALLFEIHPI